MNILDKLFDKGLLSDLRHLTKKEGFIVWSKRSKYKIILPNKVDEKLAYLSGAILGDGNISITNRKISRYPRLILRLFNASYDYLDRVNNIFYNTFGISGKISKKKDKNCYVLTVNQKLITLYFLKVIGLSAGKKINLKIPKTIKNRRLFKHFLAGLFDTDGFFTETFGIMMHGSNHLFLKEISRLLDSYYGISTRKLWKGILKTSTGPKIRSQLQIRSAHIGKFINALPLKHNKYGPVV